MHQPAGLVRKIFVFWVGDCCKWFWGVGLRNFGEMGGSRIVVTHSMSFSSR
jgi:hypothetical protein